MWESGRWRVTQLGHAVMSITKEDSTMVPMSRNPAGCGGPGAAEVLATDPARQRAYLQLFLGTVAVSDRNAWNPAEALEIVLCLSWLARLVDQATR